MAAPNTEAPQLANKQYAPQVIQRLKDDGKLAQFQKATKGLDISKIDQLIGGLADKFGLIEPSLSEKVDSGQMSVQQDTQDVAESTDHSGRRFIPDGAEDHSGKAQAVENVKAGVKEISTIGAATGAALAGTPAGIATMGMAAVPAGLTGAAVGGAVGQTIEKGINNLFFPEELENESIFGEKTIVKGAAEGVTMEMGGRTMNKAVGGTIKKIGGFMDDIATWASNKTIPWTDKYIQRAGGEDAIRKVAQLAKDKGVTTTKGTMRQMRKEFIKLKKHYGDAVEEGYNKIDAARRSQYKASSYIEETIKQYEINVKNSGVDVVEANIPAVRKILTGMRNLKDPNKVVSHTDFWRSTRAAQKTQYTTGDGSVRDLHQQTAQAMRQVNEKFANFVSDKALVGQMQEVSSAYRGISAATDTIKNSLKTKGPLGEVVALAKTLGKTGVPATVGNFVAGPVGGAVAGGAAAVVQSTAGKTTAVSAAKMASQLLGKMDALGPYGKQLARIVADKGAKAAITRHAHLMLNNEKYRLMIQGTFPDGLGAEDVE